MGMHYIAVIELKRIRSYRYRTHKNTQQHRYQKIAESPLYISLYVDVSIQKYRIRFL